MIPNQEKTVNIQGNTGADNRSQQMGIDSKSLPHLMKVLTNLYSDPEAAVIREISTNAYDSHVEAGKSDVPINVTLPTVFSPQFTVQDFGVGMSEEDVFEIFGLYGASTKRESNDYVGQLGLGCKSPLTLTNQFSLTTIKNGVKCIFSIHLDEQGIGKITKLHESLTDEGNGVTVSVAVKDVTSFNTKAYRFYRFFPAMPKFVGGELPEQMRPEVLLELDEDIKVIKPVHEDRQNDFVIMGGVAYPYRGGYASRKFDMGTVVINAPIGAVDFTPSREELHLTERTRRFVENAYERVHKVFKEKVFEKLNASKDIYEFHSNLHSLYRDLYSLGITQVDYNGLSVGLFHHSRLALTDAVRVFRFSEASFYRHSKDRIEEAGTDTVPLDKISEVVVMRDDLESDELSTYTRSKIKAWMKENQFKYLVLVNRKEDFPHVYYDKVTYAGTVSQIRKQVSSAKKNKARLVYPKFEAVFYGSLSFIDAAPSAGAEVVYAPKKVFKSIGDDLRKLFGDNPGIEFFAVTSTQENKFLKTYPKSIKLTDFLYDSFSKFIDSLPKTGYDAINFHDSLGNREIENLDLPYSQPIRKASRIEDDELRQVLEFLEVRGTSKSAGHTNLRSYHQYYKVLRAALAESQDGTRPLTNLTSKASTIGSTDTKHMCDLIRRMKAKYPLILERYSKDEYLIEYANMVAKGEKQ